MIWHVINYTEFVESLNKSRRKKLVDFVTQSRRRECVPERAIEVMPLSGWREFENPAKERRRDNGEIRAFVKIKDGVVFLIFDNLTDGNEDFHRTQIDAEIIGFIAAERPARAPSITKKDGTPFAGFNGGRRKKELTAEEKAQILAMREEGKNVNVIAKELHISNRIVSEFVKKN